MSNEKHIIVYVARHGTTALNLNDHFRGPIDVPLDKAGTRDAHQLAFYFEAIDLALIAHSAKIRTRETARTIARPKGISPRELMEREELNAWNVGDLAGKPKDAENLAIIEDRVHHPDVPLPGGESLNEFRGRIRPLIVDAMEIGMRYGVPPLLVAHSSVIHEVGSLIGGHHEYTLVEPGGVAAIYIQGGKLDAEPIFKPRSKAKQRELT